MSGGYIYNIRTINPEFKELAQTWGWKMITVHEKMSP
jgi:putative endonuclease